jgi:hypothetical protein
MLGEFAQVRNDLDLSQDVIRIVRPIIEEIQAEGGDNMAVESEPASATTETL